MEKLWDRSGPGGTAELNYPTGVAVDAAGHVYVADSYNQRIRAIDPAGNVSTLAGNGSIGEVDGTGGPNGTAEFDFPTAVAVDAGVYDVDSFGNSVRVITP